MSAGYNSNLNDLFGALGWRKLFDQILEKKSIMTYKTLHGMTPEYLRSRFVFRDNLIKLALPQPRTDYVLNRCFSHGGAQLYPGCQRVTKQKPSSIQGSSVVEQLTTDHTTASSAKLFVLHYLSCVHIKHETCLRKRVSPKHVF